MNFLEGEVLYFDKPLYWTSFKLVKIVRTRISRKLKIKKIKVGHAGTLDPLASGVMIICTGKATKLIESFQYQTKEYVATLQLGATTPSFDRETEIDEIQLLVFEEGGYKYRVPGISITNSGTTTSFSARLLATDKTLDLYIVANATAAVLANEPQVGDTENEVRTKLHALSSAPL